MVMIVIIVNFVFIVLMLSTINKQAAIVAACFNLVGWWLTGYFSFGLIQMVFWWTTQ